MRNLSACLRVDARGRRAADLQNVPFDIENPHPLADPVLLAGERLPNLGSQYRLRESDQPLFVGTDVLRHQADFAHEAALRKPGSRAEQPGLEDAEPEPDERN